MPKHLAYVLYWVPATIWMAMIFLLSSLPQSQAPVSSILPDKICHAGEYLILSLFILFALQRTTKATFSTSFWITLASVTIYGLSDEIHQLYVPTRYFDIGDLIADISGTLVLFLTLHILQKSGRRGTEAYQLLSGEKRKH